ncbi:MAG: hypothetical protein E3J72_08395 [Planctomycetota bacterium]|nr:MAG: hypothetical protein E3J72_08395 [Planctomycetota bacterium]
MKNTIVIGVATFAVGLLVGFLIAGGRAGQDTGSGTWDNLNARLDKIEKRLDSLPEVETQLAELRRESRKTASVTSEIEKTTKALKESIEPSLASTDDKSIDAKGLNKRTGPYAFGSDGNDVEGEVRAVGKELKNLSRIISRDAFVAFDPKTMEKNFYKRLQKKLDLTEGQMLDMKDLYKERGEKMKEVWKRDDSEDDGDTKSFAFPFSKEKRKKMKEVEKWFNNQAQQILNTDQYEKMKKDPMLSHGPPSAGGGFNVITWSSNSEEEDEDEDK